MNERSRFCCRTTDWLPILNTLKINKTLEFITVRSFFQQRLDDAGQFVFFTLYMLWSGVHVTITGWNSIKTNEWIELVFSTNFTLC